MKHEAGAFLIIVLWCLWVTFPFFLFGSGSYVRVHDEGDVHLPYRLYNALSPGSSGSGWLEAPICGTDRFAGISKTQPYDLLFSLMPGWAAYGLILLFRRLVAGFFTYLLLRESLKITIGPAVFGACFYSLFFLGAPFHQGGIFTLDQALGLPGLPAVLWGLDRLARSRHGLSGAIGGLLLGGVFSLVTATAFSLCVLPFVTLWFLLRLSAAKARRWVPAVLLFYMGFAVAEWPTIAALMANVSISHRANWTTTAIPAALNLEVIKSLLRDMALLVVPALAGLMVCGRKERRLIVSLVLWGIGVGYVAMYGPLRALVLDHLGFFQGFQFDRLIWPAPLVAVVGASLGLSGIERQEVQTGRPVLPLLRVRLSRFLLVGVLAVLAARSAGFNYHCVRCIWQGQNFANLYQNPQMIHLAGQAQHSAPFRVATVVDSRNEVHPAYAWAYGLSTADGYLNLYSKRYQDFWGQVIAPVMEKDEAVQNYYCSWGNRVYLFSPAEGFKENTVTASDYFNVDLLSLANVRFVISSVPLADRNLILLDCPESPSSSSSMRLGLHNSLFIYENKAVLPRVFVPVEVRIFEDRKRLLQALRQAGAAELLHTVFLDRQEAPAEAEKVTHGRGQVKIVSCTGDRIDLAAEIVETSVVVISNSYSPYWRAMVDGRDTRLFPAYCAFAGVCLPKGSHKIVLEYRLPGAEACRFTMEAGRRF